MNMLCYPTSPQSYLTLCDPMVVAHQALLSMGFCRQEYWSGLPCPLPGYLSDPGIDLVSPTSPSLAGGFFTTAAAAAAAKSLQLCPTLCDPIAGSPPGSSVPGILQARALEWVAISFSNAWKWRVKVKSLSCVRLFTTPWTAAYQAPLSIGFSRQEYFTTSAPEKESEVTQSCLTFCDPMNYSLPGSSLHGIFQARVLEWVVISSSRRSSWPRDRTWVSSIVGRYFASWATSEVLLFIGETGCGIHGNFYTILTIFMHNLSYSKIKILF